MSGALDSIRVPAGVSTDRRRFMRRRGRFFVLLCAFAAAVALGAAGSAVLLSITGTSDTQTSATTPARFHLTYPRGWEPVDPKRVSPAKAAEVAIRHRGGKGLVVVRRESAIGPLDAALAQATSRELKKRFSDYRALDARIVKVAAGPSLLLTYVRTKAKTLHSVAVVRAGRETFIIDTISDPAARKVTKEIGTIIDSFRVTR